MANVSWALFMLMIVTYGAATAAQVGYLRVADWDRRATAAARLAWAVHTVALAARWLETGRPPFISLFESFLFMTWVFMLNYLLLDFFFKLRVAALFVVSLTFWVLVAALPLPKGASGLNPLALGTWVHASIAFLGYGCLALAFIMSAMYLLQEKQLRDKRYVLFFHRLPPLEMLDGLAYRLVLVGLPLLTLTLLSGSLWARVEWGRMWGWDWKEAWTLLVWFIYTTYVFARHRLGWRGRKAGLLATVGFFAIIFNYVVVNLYLSGLHRNF